MVDEEFRTAIPAFPRMAKKGRFEQVFNVAVNGNIGSMFRYFHAKHGRYPDFDEICAPGGPVIDIVPDI